MNCIDQEISNSNREDSDSLRVLIIDDEIIMQNSLKRIFQSKNFKTFYADNLFTACFNIKKYRPHIVTLDLNLNGYSGVELVKIKEKYFSECLVIVISGEDLNKLEEAVNLGADIYLKKPFEKNDLEKIIDKFFGNYQLKNAS